MLSTAATKRWISRSTESQRDSPGSEERPPASSRTTASLSASGGSVVPGTLSGGVVVGSGLVGASAVPGTGTGETASGAGRSEEHTSELQSLTNLVCRL